MKSDMRMQSYVSADIVMKSERPKLAELSKTSVTSYISLRALMTHLPFYHQLRRVCKSLFAILKQ